MKCELVASESVTAAFLIVVPPLNHRPDTATVCAVCAALVTVTDHDAVAPGLPT